MNLEGQSMSQRIDHHLVVAIAEVAVACGMNRRSAEFVNFYLKVEELVSAYDQERSRVMDYLNKLIVDREMVMPSRAIIIKEKADGTD